MAPTKKQLATKHSQGSSVLGKRSHRPLAETSTKKQPKQKKPRQKKPAPDSHSGGTDINEPSNDKPSSAESTLALDDTFIDEVFDVDEKDIENEDATKAEEQKRQLDDWFRYCERKDPLAHLGAEERRQRMGRCHERYTFMLESLVRTAQRLKPEDFRTEVLDRPGSTFAWWTFFVHLSSEKVIVQLMASLPDAVKVVLAGPLTNEKFLMLPHDWSGLRL